MTDAPNTKDLELVIERVFDAPVDLVYAAWTDLPPRPLPPIISVLRLAAPWS